MPTAARLSLMGTALVLSIFVNYWMLIQWFNHEPAEAWYGATQIFIGEIVAILAYELTVIRGRF